MDESFVFAGRMVKIEEFGNVKEEDECVCTIVL